jgi:hypothetical protein
LKRRKIVVEASKNRDGAFPAESELGQRLLREYKDAKRNMERELSMSLLTEADELDIELPPNTDHEIWSAGQMKEDAITLLTTRGRSKIRALIDAEKARRFEVKTLWVTKFWLPLLAALVGIIGALTGLVAVLRHKP